MRSTAIGAARRPGQAGSREPAGAAKHIRRAKLFSHLRGQLDARRAEYDPRALPLPAAVAGPAAVPSRWRDAVVGFPGGPEGRGPGTEAMGPAAARCRGPGSRKGRFSAGTWGGGRRGRRALRGEARLEQLAQRSFWWARPLAEALERI